MFSKVVILAFCLFGFQADARPDGESQVYVAHTSYGLPHEDIPYPAPHNEYGVPALREVRPLVNEYEYKIPEVRTVYAPAQVYGVPTYKYAAPAPVEPIVSKYEYNLPQTVVKAAPYPQEVYGPPQAVYGPPEVKIQEPQVVYGPPQVKIEQPQPIYGPPEVKIEQPHVEYGVPHSEYGVPH